MKGCNIEMIINFCLHIILMVTFTAIALYTNGSTREELKSLQERVATLEAINQKDNVWNSHKYLKGNVWNSHK